MWGDSGTQRGRGKMYGLVLESIQHYLKELYGDDVWQEVLNHAGQHNTVFTTHRQYSDQVMLRLAEACSSLLPDVFPTVDASMHYFGTRFVEFGLVYGYDKILRVAGRHYRDFLHGIDNLHETIRFSYPRMQSPSFIVEEEDREGCVLVYRSRRRGFSHYVMGQLQQCALQLYHVKVEVSVLQQQDTDHGCHVRYRLHFNNAAYCPPVMPGALLTPADKRFATVPGSLLFQLFPFCIVFNKELIIQKVGLSAASFLGDRCQVGRSLTSVFVLRRPLVEFTWNNVVCLQGVVFELEAVTEANSQTKRGKPLPQIHVTSPTQPFQVQNCVTSPVLPPSQSTEITSPTKSPRSGEVTSPTISPLPVETTSSTHLPGEIISSTQPLSSRETTSPAALPSSEETASSSKSSPSGRVTSIPQTSPSKEVSPLIQSPLREVPCSRHTSPSKQSPVFTTQSSSSSAEVPSTRHSLPPLATPVPKQLLPSSSEITAPSPTTRELISSQLPPLSPHRRNNVSSVQTPPGKEANSSAKLSQEREVTKSTSTLSSSAAVTSLPQLCSIDRNVIKSQSRECPLANDVSVSGQPFSPTRDAVSLRQVQVNTKDSVGSPTRYPGAYVTYPTTLPNGSHASPPSQTTPLERAGDFTFPGVTSMTTPLDEDAVVPTVPVSPLGLYSSSSPTWTTASETGALSSWAPIHQTSPALPTGSSDSTIPGVEGKRDVRGFIDAHANATSPPSRMMCPFAGLVASRRAQHPTTTASTSPAVKGSTYASPPLSSSSSSVVVNATSSLRDPPRHANVVGSRAEDAGYSRTHTLDTGQQHCATGQNAVSVGNSPALVNGIGQTADNGVSPCSSSACSSSSSSPSLSAGRTGHESNNCRRTPERNLPVSEHLLQQHRELQQQQQGVTKSASGKVGGGDAGFLQTTDRQFNAVGLDKNHDAGSDKENGREERRVTVEKERPAVNSDWQQLHHHAERRPSGTSGGKTGGIGGHGEGTGGGGCGLEDNVRKKTCKKLLRGQMKLIPEWGQIAFLCTPLVSNLTELQQQGIYLNDLNMFDNSRDMVLQGHNHAPLLESLVEQQVAISSKIRENMKALDKERTQGNKLLYSMLPETIAVRLKQGHDPVNTCQTFDAVTILFSYLVGFKDICSNGGAMDVVRVINNSFAVFDHIVDKYSLYKVETLGDAVYMVAGGVPDRTDDHAQRVAYLALDFVAEAYRVKCPIENTSLSVRIGMHTGSIVAGIVGKRTPQYCLFGDTVNTAARLQSHSLPGRIHLSEPCHQCLKNTDLVSVYRGQVNVKGKGMLKTYWLAGRMGASSTHRSMLLFHKERDQHLARQANAGSVDGDLHALHASSSSSFFMAAEISTSEDTDMPKTLTDSDDVFAEILNSTGSDRKPDESTTPQQ